VLLAAKIGIVHADHAQRIAVPSGMDTTPTKRSERKGSGKRREASKEQRVEVPYNEGIANHIGPVDLHYNPPTKKGSEKRG